jgi:hypothetical protein
MEMKPNALLTAASHRGCNRQRKEKVRSLTKSGRNADLTEKLEGLLSADSKRG